ncbi:hypothetical protein Tco_0589890 [Tanacetum coccineum]
MEAAVQQYSVDKRCLEIAKNQALNVNDRLLELIVSQDIVNIVMNSFVYNASVNVHESQSQEKDTVIRNLKEKIKSLSGNVNVNNVKKDIDEIETINIELEHSVA